MDRWTAALPYSFPKKKIRKRKRLHHDPGSTADTADCTNDTESEAKPSSGCAAQIDCVQANTDRRTLRAELPWAAASRTRTTPLFLLYRPRTQFPPSGLPARLWHIIFRAYQPSTKMTDTVPIAYRLLSLSRRYKLIIKTEYKNRYLIRGITVWNPCSYKGFLALPCVSQNGRNYIYETNRNPCTHNTFNTIPSISQKGRNHFIKRKIPLHLFTNDSCFIHIMLLNYQQRRSSME